LRIKYNFDVKNYEAKRDILQYSTLATLGDNHAPSSIGAFLTKPLCLEERIKMMCLLNSSYLKIDNNIESSKNAVIFKDNGEIAESLCSDNYFKPLIYKFNLTYNINEICNSFERLISYIGLNDYEILLGLYDCERIYRSGKYIWRKNYFDSIIDCKDLHPNNNLNISLQNLTDYLQYVILIKNSEIHIYSGGNARKKLVEFYNTYYIKHKKILFQRSLCADKMLIEHLKEAKKNCFIKQPPLLQEGKDFLKIDLKTENIVIVFNTSVPDNVLTVDAFKKFIYNAICPDSNKSFEILDLEGLLLQREFDVKNADFSRNIFANRLNMRKLEPYYSFNLEINPYFDYVGWRKIEDLTFEDIFKKFVNLVKQDEYEQTTKYSYSSIAYRNNFSIGNDEQCGFLIYTY